MSGWEFTIRGWAATGALVFLTASAWRTIRRHAALEGSEQIIATALILCAVLVLAGTGVGAMGCFSFWPAVVGVVAIGAGLLLLSSGRPAESKLLPDWNWRTPIGVACIFLIASTGVHLAVCLAWALMQPPGNWDSNWYHLPVVVEWLQAGSLWAKSNVPYGPHPRNAELLVAWLLLPFDTDVAVGLFNFVVFGWTLIALWSLAKGVGMAMEWRWAALLSVANSTAVAVLLGTQKNDLLVAALFVSGLAFLFYPSTGRLRIPLVACAAGLLAGTKLNGVAYGILLIVGLAIVERRAAAGTWRSVLLGLAGAIALSGFWFVRNAHLTGQALQINDPGEPAIGPGHTLLFAADRSMAFRSMLEDLIRNGGVLALVGLACAVVLIGWRWRSVDATTRLRTRWLGFLTLACFLLFCATPRTVLVTTGHGIVRFGLPFVFLSVIGVFLIVDRLTCSWTPTLRFGTYTLFGALALVPSGLPGDFAQRFVISPRGLVSVPAFALALLGLAIGKRLVHRRMLVGGAAAVLVVLPGIALVLREYRLRHWSEAQAVNWNIDGVRSGIYRWVEGVSGQCMAVYGAQINYPMYGPRWQNRVWFDDPFEKERREGWIDRLRRGGVGVVVFHKTRLGWPEQRTWLMLDPPEHWEAIHHDDIAEAWRLRDES